MYLHKLTKNNAFLGGTFIIKHFLKIILAWKSTKAESVDYKVLNFIQKCYYKFNDLYKFEFMKQAKFNKHHP